MAIVVVFAADFCGQDILIQKMSSKIGYRLVTDKDIMDLAGKVAGMKVQQTLLSDESETRDHECSIASLKSVLSELACGDNIIISGFLGHLIPC
ncbi:MAG: hypothetical protein V1753_02860, partial [Pseudomonadota bacterium]